MTAAADPRLLFTGPSPFGWHRYETFMRCPAAYAFDLQAKAQNVRNDAPALIQGTLVHLGLAHHYARKQTPGSDLYPPLEAIHAHAEAERAAGGDAAAWAEAEAAACRALAGYAAHYAAERLRVEAVETVYALDLGDGAQLTMRIDLVVRDSAGKVYLMDHKTTGRMTSLHPVQYGASGQFLAYATLGQLKWGAEFGGLILNMIEIQDKTVRFDRPPLRVGPGRLAAFVASVRDVAHRMAALSAVPAQDWPRAPTEHTCWTRYGACAHLERCGATLPSGA